MTLGRANRTDLLLALGAAGAALVYFLSYARYGYMEDSGYLVEGVLRVMDGQCIYRDFHHTYAPGRFYLFAGLFSLFGKNLMVVRVTWAVLLAVKAGLAYWVGRRLTSRTFGLLLALLVTLLPGPWHKTLFPLTAFVLLAGLTAVAERPGVRTHLLVGVLTGVAALFRQDVAGFGAVGILALGVVRAAGRRDATRWSSFGRDAAAYAGGVLLVAVPAAVAFARAGALDDAFRGVFLEGMRDNRSNRLPFPVPWPVTDYGRAHALPVTLLKLLFYLPPVVILWTAVRTTIRFLRRRSDEGDLLLVGALVLAAGCFNQSLWRSDFPHLYQSLQPAWLLTVVLLASAARWIAGRVRTADVRWGVRAILFAAPLSLIVFPMLWCCGQIESSRAFFALREEGLYVRSVEYTGSILLRRGKTHRLTLPRAPLIVEENRARFFEIVGRVLDEHTHAGDPIVSVPGFQTVYFLFDRKNPTRYLHIRRALEPEEEDAFIRDIVDSNTELILLSDVAIDGDRQRRFPVYARRIYEWMMRNYEVDSAVGHLVFLTKRRPTVETGG